MALSKCRNFSTMIRPSIRLISKRNFSMENAVEVEPHKKVILDDKVAVITGGGSGIGFAIAKQFIIDGISSLTIIDNDTQKSLTSVEKLIKEFGEDKVLFMEGDVADSQQMDLAFRNTVLHYETIDIIVNNAGVMDDVHWENQIKTNLNGVVIGTLLGMQYMAKTSSGEGGIIVNVGSIMSVVPSNGFPVYTMTQYGIAGFSKALGSSNLYERTGVKVFGYCPGLTNTPMMKSAAFKSINKNFAKEFSEETDGCIFQKPMNVARGLVSILEKAKPGSIWIAEKDEEPYEVRFPNAETIKEKKTEIQ